jgi:hypothetical protein
MERAERCSVSWKETERIQIGNANALPNCSSLSLPEQKEARQELSRYGANRGDALVLVESMVPDVSSTGPFFVLLCDRVA